MKTVMCVWRKICPSLQPKPVTDGLVMHSLGADDSSSEDDIPFMSRDADAGGPTLSSQGGSRYEDAVERQEAGSEVDDEAEVSNPLPVCLEQDKTCLFRIRGSY